MNNTSDNKATKTKKFPYFELITGLLQIVIILYVIVCVCYNVIVYWYITIPVLLISFAIGFILSQPRSKFGEFMYQDRVKYENFIQREMPIYIKKHNLDPKINGSWNIAKRNLTNEYYSHVNKNSKKYF